MANAFVSEKGQALLSNEYAAWLVMEQLSKNPMKLSSGKDLEVQINDKIITLQSATKTGNDAAESTDNKETSAAA